MGSDCSTAVECTLRNREVLGQNPAMCLAFSLLNPLSSLVQTLQRGPTLLFFQKKYFLPCCLRQSKLNMHGLIINATSFSGSMKTAPTPTSASTSPSCARRPPVTCTSRSASWRRAPAAPFSRKRGRTQDRAYFFQLANGSTVDELSMALLL